MSVSAGPSVVTSGLVLDLDAANTKSYPGSGTAWGDLSGNGNTGTLFNTPGVDSTNGGSLTFNGTNQYLTASPMPSGTNLFTISVWMYLNTDINGAWGSIKGCLIFSGNVSGAYEFTLNTAGSAAGPPYSMTLGRYGGGATGSCTVSGINMPIQQWHNVVVLRDGASSQQMYLNGALLASGNISTSMGGGTLYMGAATANASYGGYMNGKFSNITQYNRALSAEEILQNFNALRGRYGI